MGERILLLAVGTAVVVALVGMVRWWVARRDRRVQLAGTDPLWRALGEQPDGRPTIVAFSTPSCAACRTAQAPALGAVERQFGVERVRILKVDAATRPAVASAFQVLTVPSTVVLGASGSIVAVNHGFAPAERLAQQTLAAV